MCFCCSSFLFPGEEKSGLLIMTCTICKEAHHALLHQWIWEHPYIREEGFTVKNLKLLKMCTDKLVGQCVAATVGAHFVDDVNCDFCGSTRLGNGVFRRELSPTLVVLSHYDCLPCGICHASKPCVPTFSFEEPFFFAHLSCHQQRKAKREHTVLNGVLKLLECKQKGDSYLTSLQLEAGMRLLNIEEEMERCNSTLEQPGLDTLLNNAIRIQRSILGNKLRTLGYGHEHEDLDDKQSQTKQHSEKQIRCDFCGLTDEPIEKDVFYSLVVNTHFGCMPCSICYTAKAGTSLVKTAYGKAHKSCIRKCSTDKEEDECGYCSATNCWQTRPCLLHQDEEDSMCSLM